ncbi:hypothetical protein R6Q57_009159, partial [Mikania cordata]
MAHIYDELIIFEILTRVPATTVGRSNCVCKKWKALLLTPQFKIHCSRSLIAANQRAVLVDDLTCSAHRINFQSGAYGPGTILSFPFNNVTIFSHFDGLLNIPFLTRLEYVRPYFSLSSGTFCVDTLYFTVCDCWIGGENVLLCFDVNSEIFKEITFPSLASAGMTFGDLVNIKNELYMFVSTSIEFMWVELWMLEDDHWIKTLLFPQIPPIPLGLFCEITHFMTN